MRFSSLFRNRNLVLGGFVSLVTIIVVIGLLGAWFINRVVKTSSEARDELLPAFKASQVVEKLYQNRLSVEDHIVGSNPNTYAKIEQEILKNYAEIDSIMVDYTDIYQYSNRNAGDNMLKHSRDIKDYQQLEQQVLRLSREGEKQQALVIFIGQSAQKFQQIINPIHSIMQDHVAVGDLRFEDARLIAAYARLALYMSVGLAFVVVIVIGTAVGFSHLMDD